MFNEVMLIITNVIQNKYIFILACLNLLTTEAFFEGNLNFCFKIKL